MAVSVNWVTSVITVEKADTALVDIGPPENRSYDVDVFRLALKALEDDVVGMHWPDTHVHTGETVIGGVTYARFVEILDPYTVTFEDGSYIVTLEAANNNIIEKTNLNSVSVRGNNSAGLTSVTTPQETADAFLARKATGGSDGTTATSVAAMLQAGGSWKIDSSNGISVTFADVDGSTIFTRTFTREDLDALRESSN